MAGADYRHCDVCGGKAFYDANLQYDDRESAWNKEDPPFRIAGAPQYADPDMNEKYGLYVGYVGDWAVICNTCAKTHRTAIVPIETGAEAIDAALAGVPASVVPADEQINRLLAWWTTAALMPAMDRDFIRRALATAQPPADSAGGTEENTR